MPHWCRWTLVVLAVVAASASGCRKRSSGDTFVSGSDIFTTDDFPGAPVQDGNLADDRRAMSPSGEEVLFFDFVRNGDSGAGMLVWVGTGPALAPPSHVYASYYDGESFTPPVTLTSPDANLGAGLVFPARVAFFNTADHASDVARDRDGDAVLLWLAPDVDDDGASTADGVNSCLYANYFNASAADDPAQNYGFQVVGTKLNSRDMAGENAGVFGFATDGLCGETRFGGANAYRYGHATTSLVCFWNQLEDNDAADPAVEDSSLAYAWFDPASGADPEAPVVPTAATRILAPGGSDAGLDSEETQVDNFFAVYNNVLFYRVAAKFGIGADVPGVNFPATGLTVAYGDLMPADDDVTLFYVVFDLVTGAAAPPVPLNTASKNSADAVESNMAFISEDTSGIFVERDTPSIYGSDEGLASILIFYVELTADGNAGVDFGDMTIDSQLVIAQIEQATGVLDSLHVVSAGNPAIFDNVDQFRVSTRISRNGDYVWVFWTQPEASGGSDDYTLFAAQIVTTRPDDDGLFTLPSVSSATSSPLQLSTDIDGSSVNWTAFQAALGYVCGAQSDPDVMSLAFQHSDGTSDQVFIARLTADLSVPPAPAAAVTLFETFFNGDRTTLHVINHDYEGFIFVDAGENGDVVAAYLMDVDSTGALDSRLFSRRNGSSGGVVEIDSAVATRQTFVGNLRAIVTPPGSDIGTFDVASGEDSDDRPHPAETVHFLFHETNSTESAGAGLALRTRRFRAGDSSIPFAEAFTPSAGTPFEEPTEISLPFVDPSTAEDASVRGVAVSGDSVGVWFTELSHAYYQEFNDPGDDDGNGWRESDGVSDPALIDDDSETELAQLPVFFAKSCACDDLGGAALVWTKVFDVLNPVRRLQVRVRSDDVD